jgi:hypothetical protein
MRSGERNASFSFVISNYVLATQKSNVRGVSLAGIAIIELRRRVTKQKYQKNATNRSAHFLEAIPPVKLRSQIASAPLQFLPNHAEKRGVWQ